MVKQKQKKLLKRTKLLLIFLPVLATASIFILIISSFYLKKDRDHNLEVYLSNGEFDNNAKLAYFEGKEYVSPPQPYPDPRDLTKVLSAGSYDNKWIEVDLTQQKLRAWQGDSLVYEFLASTGKRQWGASTPTGVYNIWIKLRSTKMEGGAGAHYYYLPNVQCTQFFNQGYGIHGTYWHNNFGHPMSHGCVNLSTEDACTLFYWTSPTINSPQKMARANQENPGTKVVVHGETPLE